MIDGASDLKIVAIGGSLREGSFSHLALEHAARLLTDLGCQTRLLDLRVTRLPFCNGDNNDPRREYPAVAELRRAVRDAHGLVLATPEYHGGVSGVLKNTLDLLSAEHLAGKVAGVISVSGGGPNSNALNDLSRILRCCHAWVLPQQIAIGRAQAVFLNGEITDTELLNRFVRFAHSLAWSAARIGNCAAPLVPIDKKQKGVIHETIHSSLPRFRVGGESTGMVRSVE
jgi:FMN reductase